MKRQSARTFFGAAVILYLVWVAALASLVIASASRPAPGKRLPAPARASSLANPEPAKN